MYIVNEAMKVFLKIERVKSLIISINTNIDSYWLITF